MEDFGGFDLDDKDETESEDLIDDLSLVEKNSTSSTTDVIMDLKTGIYNLFISLFHQYAGTYGPEAAVSMSTDFLEEIIFNFRNAIVDDAE